MRDGHASEPSHGMIEAGAEEARRAPPSGWDRAAVAQRRRGVGRPRALPYTPDVSYFEIKLACMRVASTSKVARMHEGGAPLARGAARLHHHEWIPTRPPGPFDEWRLMIDLGRCSLTIQR